MSKPDATEVNPKDLKGEFRLLRQLRLAEFDAVVAKLCQKRTEERLDRFRETTDFEELLFEQIAHVEKREERLKAQYTYLQTELVAANERERKAMEKYSCERNEKEELHKAMLENDEALRAEYKTQLDEKEAAMRAALTRAEEKQAELKKRYEEAQEQIRRENEDLRSKIGEVTLAAREKEISSVSEAEPIRLSDTHAEEENVEEIEEAASDPDDGVYTADEVFSRKAASQCGQQMPPQGVLTRQRRRQMEASPVMQETPSPATQNPVKRSRKPAYPSRLCVDPLTAINARVLEACRGSQDPAATTVLPFEIVLPPVLQKRSTNKRKLVSRSATSHSAGIGLSDEAGDEDTRPAKTRSGGGKEKPWQLFKTTTNNNQHG